METTSGHPAFRVFRFSLLNPTSFTSFTWIPDGALVVNSEGSIAYSGCWADLPREYHAVPVEEYENCVALPGFIDLHVHLPQFHARGKFGKDLLSWLHHVIFPIEATFADPGVARRVARSFFASLAAHGTTTAMVLASVHEEATEIAFEEARRSRLRVILGKINMDMDCPENLRESTTESLAATERLIKNWHGATDKLRYAVTPRYALSCSEDLLRGCADLAGRYGTYIQTHINENLEEIKKVRERFHTSYAELYHRTGLLGKSTVLAHNVHPEEAEIDLLKRTDTAVAHCPDANLFLGSGKFNIEKHLDRGIRFGLGTDVGAGTSLSMLRTMRAMAYVQGRSLHPAGPLYTATRGGAVALGLEKTIGSLNPGACADFVVLDFATMEGDLRGLSADDAAAAIVYKADPHAVLKVYAGGEHVYSRDDQRRAGDQRIIDE